MKDENCEIKAIYALAFGRVQGVGFRYSTVKRALALGLKGYARNMSDGSVEVMAEGSAEAIEKLVKYLKQGPPAARVDRLDFRYLSPKGYYRSFNVEY
ncbi:MAG: acylphosphatase [Spirochaetales bacterium]|nr:acylphosphatase [Spirochaetales bacterium]